MKDDAEHGAVCHDGHAASNTICEPWILWRVCPSWGGIRVYVQIPPPLGSNRPATSWKFGMVEREQRRVGSSHKRTLEPERWF
jgi:hypothetical protein